MNKNNFKYIFLYMLFVFPLISHTKAASVSIDLSSWVPEDYVVSSNVTSNGPANWTIGGPGNTVASQSLNSDPSILRSNNTIDIAGKRITGTLRVDTNVDDDLIGFVFGYQNRGQMYQFGWKKTSQEQFEAGMYIRLIDTGNPGIDPALEDFQTTIDTTNTTILKRNTIPWVSFTNYDFVLNFGEGMFEITISQEGSVLANWTVNDSTFTGGDFGIFNQSQPGARYTIFTQEENICTPGTVSPNLDIHVPSLDYESLLGKQNIWADLEYLGKNDEGKHIWSLKDFGENE